MTHYVVGFAFSSNCEKVVLIQKNRPKWQAGKLNGVGGHVEEGEGSVDAMVREYREETGVSSAGSDWRRFGHLNGYSSGSDESFHVVCYAAFDDKLLSVHSLTDEIVAVYPAPPFDGETAGYPVVSNLNWLIPLALDSKRENYTLYVAAEYRP